jgi:hypothetical protein
MLCKAPVEMIAARNEYYETQNARQMESVDQSLFNQNDPRMPLFSDRKTRVTRGRQEFGTGT